MADDLPRTSKPDELRIDIHRDAELTYWSQKLNATPDEIRWAVAWVGPTVKQVREFLNRR